MTAVIVANCVRAGTFTSCVGVDMLKFRIFNPAEGAKKEVLDTGILKQLLRLLSSGNAPLQAIGSLAIGNAAAGSMIRTDIFSVV